MLEIGRIGKAHGVRGEVAVHLTTNRTERLDPGSVLMTEHDATLTVASSRPHQDRFIVRFVECSDRNAAEALRGQVLRAKAITVEGELWVHDLIGARVVEISGTDRGAVVAVEENPASDLLVLESGALVPLTFLVTFEDGVATVEVPLGLFDDDDAAATSSADDGDAGDQPAGEAG